MTATLNRSVGIANLLARAGALALLASCALAPHAQPRQPDLSAVAELVTQFTNALRREHGLADTASNARLADAARAFAEYMARTDQYAHDADGRRPAERIKAAGYRYCMVGENIGFQASSLGFSSDQLARRMVDGWADSPDHRRNMLEPRFTEIGIGVARSERSGRYYGVQLFGRPETAATEFAISNRSGTPVRYELDGRAYNLEPRVTRTHQGCLEGEVRLLWPEGQRGPAVRLGSGRYAVVRDATGALILQNQ